MLDRLAAHGGDDQNSDIGASLRGMDNLKTNLLTGGYKVRMSVSKQLIPRGQNSIHI